MTKNLGIFLCFIIHYFNFTCHESFYTFKPVYLLSLPFNGTIIVAQLKQIKEEKIKRIEMLTIEELKVVMIGTLREYEHHTTTSLSSTLNTNYKSCEAILFEIINSDTALQSKFKTQQLINKSKPAPQPTIVILDLSSVDQNVARCPKCESKSLSLEGTTVTCLKFGKRFWIGSRK